MKIFTLSVGNVTIEVARKKVKHIHLTVCPPDGKVRISAPLFVSRQQLHECVSNRIDWIELQQHEIKQRYCNLKRDIKTGELHYFLGKPLFLEVVEKNTKTNVAFVKEDDTEKLILTIHSASTLKQRQRVLNNWYRKQLELQIAGFLDKWQTILGISVTSWKIRKMKIRWGSCYPEEKLVLFNLELIKTPKESIEYVVLHELIHLFEIRHNKRFYSFFDRFMPQWRVHKKNLEKAPINITS